MYILGIIGFGENPAACLLRDGKIISFAEEERFTRLKGSDGMFPIWAVKFCLKFANINIEEVDKIAFGWQTKKYPWKMLSNFSYNYLKYRKYKGTSTTRKYTSSGFTTAIGTLLEYSPKIINDKILAAMRYGGIKGDLPEIVYVDHHIAHAYSTYFCSDFNKAGILTMDGSGENICTQLAFAENDRIDVVEEYKLPHSLGWFYAAITEYLGFQPYRDEGKVMGLAALGEARKNNNKWIAPLREIITIENDFYEVDPTYTKFGSHYFGNRYTDKLVKLITSIDSSTVPIGYGEKINVNGEIKSKYLLETYIDLAWAAQDLLESAGIMLARKLVNNYNVENICIAGGVGMNCKMNGEILRKSGAKNIFVQPASSDSGTALGAAMYVAKNLGENIRNPLNNVYMGPGYTNDQVLQVLKNCGTKFIETEYFADAGVDLLEKNKIIGWFQGRMEFGARALGNRSILANPAERNIKYKVNERVKFRENWRPFCPSITADKKSDYINNPNETKFMIVAYEMNRDKQNKLPSVAHVDGTIRPQTITRDINLEFYNLISNLGKKTGHPVVLNTSFNVRGEPIVCTPLEAIRCFYSTGLDALIINNFILIK